MVGFASQLSVAVIVMKLGVAGQLIVASTHGPFNTGGVLSITLMVWLTGADTLPQASVALHVLLIE